MGGELAPGASEARGARDPEDCLQIAQAAGTILDVGLEVVGGVLMSQVSLLLLQQFRVIETVQIDRCCKAAAEAVVQRTRSGKPAMLEQASADRHIAFHLVLALLDCAHRVGDFESRVTHGFADSSGVKIHYASIGSGPLMVMIHGFPDFWYTWRPQMEALSDRFQCVAIDQRGYNLSDKPKGVENYSVRLLVADVAAVIAPSFFRR